MSAHKESPNIDTPDFELSLGTSGGPEFLDHRDEFISLIRRIIDELELTEHIEHVNVSSPDRGRA